MKFTTTFLALLFFVSLNAQWNKKVKGNGSITTEIRSVSDYDKISISGNFDVLLVKGSEGEISIKADENLMEYISCEVKKDLLSIKTKKGYSLKSSKTIEIIIPFKDINSVSLAGSGNIKTEDSIETNNLKINLAGSGNMNMEVSTRKIDTHIAGSGNINLKGDSNEFSCNIAGSGNLNGESLKTDIAIAKIAGSGNIKIKTNKEIQAKIAGSGNVFYYGNPKIVKSNSIGSGSIKKKG
ncbi:head GIN domain-containing protein [Lutibacter citreus]|uniref:head GIN domain-containing protein n=1 Tax=Lutibacter citreus TaxID=2138210 RepID=UPI000DBE1A5E|nr:head GIN domain-containing protein [Lutibacter citreus]